MGARYYDPSIGRFITPDPLDASVSAYTFAADNPVMFFDPSGLEADQPEEVRPTAAVLPRTNRRSIISVFEDYKRWEQGGFRGRGPFRVVFSRQNSEAGNRYLTNRTRRAPSGGRTCPTCSSNSDFRDAVRAEKWRQYAEEERAEQASRASSNDDSGNENVISNGSKKKDGTGEEQKRNVSDKGKAFIKSYEKLSLTVYDASDSDETDPSKMKDPTIGWGHSLKGNDEELTHYAENGISKEDADALFEKDVKIATDDANAIATTPLTQNEFDAFASLLYSAGRTNVVRGGKTLSALNSGNKRRTARIWRRAFITSFKKELDGLKYRRRDEVELFLHGDYKRDY